MGLGLDIRHTSDNLDRLLLIFYIYVYIDTHVRKQNDRVFEDEKEEKGTEDGKSNHHRILK